MSGNRAGALKGWITRRANGGLPKRHMLDMDRRGMKAGLVGVVHQRKGGDFHAAVLDADQKVIVHQKAGFGDIGQAKAHVEGYQRPAMPLDTPRQVVNPARSIREAVALNHNRQQVHMWRKAMEKKHGALKARAVTSYMSTGTFFTNNRLEHLTDKQRFQLMNKVMEKLDPSQIKAKRGRDRNRNERLRYLKDRGQIGESTFEALYEPLPDGNGGWTDAVHAERQYTIPMTVVNAALRDLGFKKAPKPKNLGQAIGKRAPSAAQLRVLRAAQAAWDATQHPRGPGGKFRKKPDVKVRGGDVIHLPKRRGGVGTQARSVLGQVTPKGGHIVTPSGKRHELNWLPGQVDVLDDGAKKEMAARDIKEAVSIVRGAKPKAAPKAKKPTPKPKAKGFTMARSGMPKLPPPQAAPPGPGGLAHGERIFVGSNGGGMKGNAVVIAVPAGNGKFIYEAEFANGDRLGMKRLVEQGRVKRGNGSRQDPARQSFGDNAKERKAWRAVYEANLANGVAEPAAAAQADNAIMAQRRLDAAKPSVKPVRPKVAEPIDPLQHDPRPRPGQATMQEDAQGRDRLRVVTPGGRNLRTPRAETRMRNADPDVTFGTHGTVKPKSRRRPVSPVRPARPVRPVASSPTVDGQIIRANPPFPLPPAKRKLQPKKGETAAAFLERGGSFLDAPKDSFAKSIFGVDQLPEATEDLWSGKKVDLPIPVNNNFVVKQFKGGINPVYTLTNNVTGEQVILKLAENNDPLAIQGAQNVNEELGSTIFNAIGVMAGKVETVSNSDNAQWIIADHISNYVYDNGYGQAYNSPGLDKFWSYVSRNDDVMKQATAMITADFVLGSWDRHGKNWGLTNDGKTLLAWDFGRIGNYDADRGQRRSYKHEMSRAPREMRAKARAQVDATMATLRATVADWADQVTSDKSTYNGNQTAQAAKMLDFIADRLDEYDTDPQAFYKMLGL